MNLLHAVAASVFAAPCPLCALPGLGGRLCDPCYCGLPRLERDRACSVCGGRLSFVPAAGADRRCAACLDGRVFARARALGPLLGGLHDLVLALKFGGRRSLGYDLGRRVAAELAAELGPADAVVAVPLHRRRRRQRGYDQADVIARGVAAALGLPLLPRTLTRVRETAPQTGLSRTARLDNLRRAFRSRAAHGRLLLIDDVLTTGATVEAAAALRAGGAAEVTVLTLARTARRDEQLDEAMMDA